MGRYKSHFMGVKATFGKYPKDRRNFSDVFPYPNLIIGSKVTAILMNGWILPIGGVALGRVCACNTFVSSFLKASLNI